MIRSAPIALALALAAGSLGSGCARAAAEPTAAEVVARNAEARGGLDAWRKIDTMVWVGRVESARAPVPDLRFALEQKRPNKTRLEIHALGQESVRIFDGAHGWKARPSRGRPELEPYSPEELRFAQAGPGIDGPLIDSAARGSTVTLASLDRIGERKAYHLRVHTAGGGDEDVWVDAETWLDLRYDRTAEGPLGAQRRVSITYGDYRTVDGVKLPFRIETGGGPMADKMQLETVVLNLRLDDSTFESPTGRPRTRERPGAAVQADVAAPTANAEREAPAPR